jgi:disease resistance protein RPM1
MPASQLVINMCCTSKMYVCQASIRKTTYLNSCYIYRTYGNNFMSFIVIDDVWDVPSWNTIRHAIDDNSLLSKIVITTGKRDVAAEVGCFYEMKPLCYEIKLLFYSRIFGSEEKYPKDFSEVSVKFLKKCGGVPLAIITTSSLLANKLGNIKEWIMLY